ncbi:glycosyl hydrolase [Mucilaginibacter sp. UYCu711]|uniref:glycosyl hydrolase n=1 Tax=Mucilaginibacter sp. UYCu711 TaxID=3156339 RepID=UPI003D2275B8
MNPQKTFIALAAFLLIGPAFAQKKQGFNTTSAVADPQMVNHFKTPPHVARPWVFWMWLRVNTSKEAITKDLEEMKAKGIEGAILYESGTGSELSSTLATMVLKDKKYVFTPTKDFAGAYMNDLPTAHLQPWDNRVRELFRFAAKEAGRLGVKLVLSVGLAGTSGPIPAEYGQQRMLWSEKNIEGGTVFGEVLPEPNETVSATYLSSAGIAADYKRKSARQAQNPKTPKFIGHEIAVLAIPQGVKADAFRVINLSDKIDADGRLRWDAPAGKWKILRFAYQPTNKGDVWGLFTDGMSAEALDTTWRHTIGRMLKEMTPAEKRGLTGIEDDSWEGGETTWTKQFPQKFKDLRNYDLIPRLPALVGITIGDSVQSDGIRRDYYRTIADLIAKNHYGRLKELANKHGLISYSEASGPNSAQLDGMKNSNGVDVAMGEFWVPSVHRPTPDRRFLLRNTANANHIYGKLLTPCEAFTSVGPHWEETFFDLKNVADQAFCDGANSIVFHNFSHSSSVTGKPGFVYFAGTHYSRNVTWWEQTPAFNAYVGRCSYMLQQGLFVADALYYVGDGIGHGEPQKTQPALPARGYDHDNLNLDALLTRVSVKNGRFVLPDGMSYKILVMPGQAKMDLKALEKINSLVAAGGIVVGPRPDGVAGLVGSETAWEEKIISDIWDKPAAKHVIADRTAAEVLNDLHIAPDFAYTGLSNAGDIDWIHRKAGNEDIYFIASRWDAQEKINATFRVNGKRPEIWDPVTGETRPATAFTQANGLTTVPLEFDPRGSVFIVFRKPIAIHTQGNARSNYPALVTKTMLTGGWELHFDPKWGGPATLHIDSLMDWTKFDDYNIRHYSGTAVYNKTFRVDKASARKKLILDLGVVHEEAVVKVNGVNMGVIWTKPAQVDISRAAHPGINKLEITVVNLWPNRLIGDEPLPVEKRFTLTNMHKFNKDTPLYPSGLIGPVKLEEVE